jgi:hypothetical protein
MYKSKDEAAGALFELDYILGAETVLRELICFMSLDDIHKFVSHIHQHYEIKQREAEYETAFNQDDEIPW